MALYSTSYELETSYIHVKILKLKCIYYNMWLFKTTKKYSLEMF
jgi:hypothetical protein